jgi:hypothetical protein
MLGCNTQLIAIAIITFRLRPDFVSMMNYGWILDFGMRYKQRDSKRNFKIISFRRITLSAHHRATVFQPGRYLKSRQDKR